MLLIAAVHFSNESQNVDGEKSPYSDTHCDFRRFGHVRGGTGITCIKVALPGKLIFSQRKGLWESYSLENSL